MKPEDDYVGWLKLGTIADRHPMPVDRYIIGELKTLRKAYERLYEATLYLHRCGVFDGVPGVLLYYTGRTEATVAVLDALDQVGVSVVLMTYDERRCAYTPVQRRNLWAEVEAP